MNNIELLLEKYLGEVKAVDNATGIILKKIRCRECDGSDFIMKKKGKRSRPYCNDCKEFTQFYTKD
jgi:hypothetical protein